VKPQLGNASTLVAHRIRSVGVDILLPSLNPSLIVLPAPDDGSDARRVRTSGRPKVPPDGRVRFQNIRVEVRIVYFDIPLPPYRFFFLRISSSLLLVVNVACSARTRHVLENNERRSRAPGHLKYIYESTYDCPALGPTSYRNHLA